MEDANKRLRKAAKDSLEVEPKPRCKSLDATRWLGKKGMKI